MIVENIRIEKLVNQGYGLGYYEGNTLFIPYVLPGDLVDVEITKTKKAVWFGTPIKIVESNYAHRTELCEVTEKCGGCDWLFVPYHKQLEFKQQIIEDTFKRREKDNVIKPIIACTPNKQYRNKSYLPVGIKKGEINIGMYERKSHTIIPFLHCQLLPECYEAIYLVLMDYIHKSKIEIYNELTTKGNLRYVGIRSNQDNSEILVFLITKNRKLPFSNQLVRDILSVSERIVGVVQNINPEATNNVLGTENKILTGKDYLQYRIGKNTFRVSLQSFLQVNRNQIESLYQIVKDNIEAGSTVVDAYSGTGTIGIHVADKAKKVYCIESNETAHNDAVINANQNNIENVEFKNAKVEDLIKELTNDKKIDTIIFDPPRKGLDSTIIDVTTKAKIKQIIYVSCNPATLQRDITAFIDNGYRIDFIQPVDMFPHTYHIECIARLIYNE